MSRLYSARVRGGVVVPEGVALPDGTAVTIAVNDERETEVELTPAELAALDDAIADADRSERCHLLWSWPSSIGLPMPPGGNRAR